METSLDSKFIETSEGIITQLGFKDLKSFVKSQALLMVLAKIEKYEVENKRFTKKYRMDFKNFQAKLKQRKNEEVFSEEDDYLDWRFSIEALERLRSQKQEL